MTHHDETSGQSHLNMQQLQRVFALYSAGHFAEALKLARDLDRECPNEPLLLNLLGAIHAALADYEASVASFEKAIELRPDVPDTQFHLGNTLFEKGDLAAAIGCFRRAVEIRSDYPEANSKLCQTLERSNRIDELEGALESALREMTGGTLNDVAALDERQIESLRRVYFDELDKYLDPGERPLRVVDKLPLNLVQAGVIQRVFPQARFIFAQRHPCDAVLSCYMRAFIMNAGMVNCLDLAEAARLYDSVMRLWTQYQDVLPLQVHTVRYETLIRDFDSAVSACLDFLDMDWDDGVRDYVETAKRSGQISTPSYDQVTQALYTGASGRWQRYRKHLEPVLPVLLPWAERMGYTE